MFHRRKRIRRQTLVVVMFSREATVSMFCYFYFFYSSPVTVASSVLLFLNDRPLLSTVPMLDLCHHLAILMVYFLSRLSCVIFPSLSKRFTVSLQRADSAFISSILTGSRFVLRPFSSCFISSRISCRTFSISDCLCTSSCIFSCCNFIFFACVFVSHPFI